LPADARKSFVAALATRYGQRLRRFLATRARNASDVPDLAQEVFLRLMRVDNHETIRSPEAYLMTVASHVLHQHSLRQSHAPITLDVTEVFTELQLISGDDPASHAEAQQRIEDLQRALAQLPPRVSAALMLHRFAGFSIEEIGKQLGVARPTAKKYIAQALTHCRNMRTLESE
jgi:RNA polymerase sigma factor (sigma-70 family)